ncbi:MAG: cysteine--tRNA ligase [Bacilli bacterium]|nr:cysteine--tRNA ligase [Bacilli bacterium]
MKIYNTLSKSVEEFVPNNGKEVNMYTCGPTVYHYAHIGNLRTYIFEDVLEKSLNFLGYHVNRVMNITDVGHLSSDADTGEDKMLMGAKREHKTVYEIADFYTKAFFSDASKLNIKKPDIVSKASDNIDEYIKIINKLLDTGYAYKAGNNVYFDISKAKDYYKLSGKNEEELIIGARDDVTEDTEKRNPYDFALWFTKSKFDNQEMKWDSPYGVGYPGWHIECSGISLKYLGEYLDIHCGGVDNIFPHHTNEIAQSEAYIGHKWCNYWIHGEHLNDKSGKMSKSKGEFLTVSLLQEKGYNPLSYRFMCLQSHYRNQLVFSYDSLDIAESAYNKLKNRIKSLVKNNETLNDEKIKYYINSFKDALSNDLNTSNALTVLFEALKDNNINDDTKLYLVEEFDKVLSLSLIEDKKEVDNELIDKINKLIEERNNAKKDKNYELADKIRNDLLEMNVVIKDTREGTIFEIR